MNMNERNCLVHALIYEMEQKRFSILLRELAHNIRKTRDELFTKPNSNVDRYLRMEEAALEAAASVFRNSEQNSARY